MINDLLKKIIILYRKLEIIIDFLLFTTKIIILDKTFLKRIFNAIRKSIIIIRISLNMRVDLL